MTLEALRARLAPTALIDAASLPKVEAGLASIVHLDLKPTAGFWFAEDDYRSVYRPYTVQNGVLRVPVQGTLLNGFPWVTGYATGYDYIAAAMKRGVEDPDVDGIALLIDSPGGEVAGNFDLVDSMYAMRGSKPIRAFAAEDAYSAAYNIASAADTITVTRSGGVGSIGVVTMHMDVSGALEKMGLKVTFIYAGKHKVDGNPFEPLSEDVRDRVQARVDNLYSEFVASVARNRGMDEGAVRATEAATFTAAEAVSNGLADAIGSLDASLADFEAEVLSRRSTAMAEKDAAFEAAKKQSYDEGFEAGLSLARTEERGRIAAILGSDAAAGREELARTMALDTDLSPDAAVKLLAASPKAEAPVASTPFEAAMDATPNPEVGEGPTAEDDPDGVKATLSLVRTAGLAGFKN